MKVVFIHMIKILFIDFSSENRLHPKSVLLLDILLIFIIISTMVITSVM